MTPTRRKEALHVQQKKLAMFQTSLAHISTLWEHNGHQRWQWVFPALNTIEQQFDALSTHELQQRLRNVYRRLKHEKERVLI